MSRSSFRRAERGFSLFELLIVGVVLVIAILIVVPLIRRQAETKTMKTCQENLTRVDGAKEQWALENNKSPGTPVTESDIVKPGVMGYLSKMPACSGGQSYLINEVGTNPQCTSGHPGHELEEICCVITELE